MAVSSSVRAVYGPLHVLCLQDRVTGTVRMLPGGLMISPVLGTKMVSVINATVVPSGDGTPPYWLLAHSLPEAAGEGTTPSQVSWRTVPVTVSTQPISLLQFAP